MQARSRNKIALLFFAITAAAFGVIYFSVVPQPESNLEERRLSDLERVAGVYQADARALRVEQTPSGDARAARCAALAEATDSRVTLFDWKEDPEGRQRDKRGLELLRRVSDSREERAVPRATTRSLRRAIRTAADAERLRQLPGRGHRHRRPAAVGPATSPQWVGRSTRATSRRSRRPSRSSATACCWPRCAALLVALDRRLARRAPAGAARAARGARRRRGRRAAASIDPLPGGLRGRARPAHAHLQRDAGAAARRSTWRARSSSPPPRTSCARRSSRWPASSSCCRTRTSTRRRGASSSTRCASRSRGCRSCRSTCSTCRGSTPARSSSQTEPVDLAELAARRSSASSRPRSPTTAPSSRCDCRRRARRPTATASGWPRSCASCSTTRSATRRRAPTSP